MSFSVEMRFVSFNTEEDAKKFEDALITAFCNMPEADGVGAISYVVEETEE